MDLISQSDLVNSVRAVQNAGTDLKMVLFKSFMKGETAWKVRKDEYISKVYSFINTWKERAAELQEGIKSASGAEGIWTIKQNSVREYLYASYDYASILPFVDGIFRGIKKNEFDNPRDFNDFWKYTAQKAFKGRADSIGGLVEEVIGLMNDSDPSYQASVADAKMFDAIKHQQIFKPTDSRELFKSIEKAIEFIFYSHDDGQVNYPEGDMMRVAVVNAIVDYATYSLTAYATRIYAINIYASPYINNNKSYSESVEEYSTNISLYNVMKETDEGMARDFRNLSLYVEKLEEFLTEIGVHDEIEGARSNLNYPGEQWRRAISSGEENVYNAALLANPLRELLSGYLGMACVSELKPGERLQQAGEVLRNCMYNSRAAYGDTSSPRNELLEAIARIKPEKKTMESLQSLGSDLVKFCGALLFSIYSLIKDHSDHELADPKNYWEKKGSFIREEQGIVVMLVELYRDIAVALLYRARDIEDKINTIRALDREKLEDQLTIKVPGGLERKTHSRHSVMAIVPVTTRVPLEVMNLYSVPYQDQLNLYDEVAKILLPGDPFYFTEDGDDSLLNKVLNAITSFFDGIGNRAAKFANDVSLGNARNWVQKHESELNSIKKYPPMTVKPYKNTLDLNLSDLISMTEQITRKENALDNSGPEAFENALKRLSPEIYALNKNGESDSIVAIQKNHLLYGLPLVKSSAEEPSTKELKSEAEINTQLKYWIKTVLDAPDVLSKFAKEMKRMKELINEFRKNSANWLKELENKEPKEEPKPTSTATKQEQKTDGSGDNTPTLNPGAAGNSETSGGTGTGTQTTLNAESVYYKEAEELTVDTAKKNLENLVKDLNTAYMQWNLPIYQAIVQAVKDQYKYIQIVWTNSKKND